MDNELLSLSNNDIPFVEAQISNQSNLDNITELDNNSCLRKILRGEENE